MFDEVTKQERGRRATRTGTYIAASAAFQVLWIAAAVLMGDRHRATATGGAPMVDVKFFRAAPSPSPPPAPPAPGRHARPQPMARMPREVLAPAAMSPPTEIPTALEPTSESRSEPDEGEAGEAAGGAGTEGGVAGGVVGGVPGGERQGGSEDAPVYATTGFRRPEQAVRNCVPDSIRIPRDLQGFVSGPIAVKFAVRRDGSPAYFAVMTPVPDKRIGDAIWQAVTGCRWIPGADAQGRPTTIWVILPIRFRSG